MKSGPDRKYTPAFRQAAVQQVQAGEVCGQWRARWRCRRRRCRIGYRARQGLALSKRQAEVPVTELEAEVSRLRAENARLNWQLRVGNRKAEYADSSNSFKSRPATDDAKVMGW